MIASEVVPRVQRRVAHDFARKLDLNNVLRGRRGALGDIGYDA